jgi:hypothetical protein
MTGNTGSYLWVNLLDISLEFSSPKVTVSLLPFFSGGRDSNRPPSIFMMLTYPGLLPRGNSVKLLTPV